MTRVSSEAAPRRLQYHIRDLIGPNCGAGIVGFDVVKQQPYRAGMGLRLSAPRSGPSPRAGYTEVVQVAEGLQAAMIDWKTHPQDPEPGFWAVTDSGDVGWLYVGNEGDGCVEVEGWGMVRRPGRACSVTLMPPGSTMVWCNQPVLGRRGVAVAFHRRFMQEHYGSLLRHCGRSLQSWVACRDVSLRDFDIPLCPVMAAVTSSLLSLRLEGELRHRFVCASAEQLLCLALAGVARVEEQMQWPIHLSARDKNALREVRALLDRRLANPPSVSALSKQFGMNRNKLRIGFKDLFGLGIGAYIHERRMSEAYARLSSGNTSVSTVAASAGYAHLCSFSTAFRRRFGKAPSQILRRAEPLPDEFSSSGNI